MTDEMTITAVVPWFGSKRTLAPAIIAALGPHRSYWGICCGSLAVELSKPPAAMETCIDLHGDLTNLAWVLQREEMAVELYRRLNRTLMAETLYLASQAVILAGSPGDEADIDRAYHYMITSWMGRNGMAGTQREDSQIAVRWTHNGGSPAGRWRAVVDSVPAWHHRLKGILILRRDIFDVLGSIDDAPGTAIYADPPYLLATRKAKGHTLRSGGKYKHEFTEADHARLAEALCRFRNARVVVSYYADPRLADLYPGWEQQRHDMRKAISVQGRRGAVAQEAPEVLLVNDMERQRDEAASVGGLFATERT